MLNLGTDEIVKYPFLAEAGKYLSDKGFSLEQFGTDPDLKRIVDMAVERIKISINKWGNLLIAGLNCDMILEDYENRSSCLNFWVY